MRTLSILLVVLLLVPFAVAGNGPSARTVSATTAGVVVNLFDSASSPPTVGAYIVCPADGVTVAPYRYVNGAWEFVGNPLDVASPDTLHIPGNMIGYVEGKFHLLRITTDTSTESVDVHVYSK